MCGVCSVEVPEAKFDDHRYAEHLGLARPYGMSQVITFPLYLIISSSLVAVATFQLLLRYLNAMINHFSRSITCLLQEFSDSEKRRELKKALLLKKQVSCPYCYRIFTSTLGFQYHQTRCLAEVGETPK